MEDSCPDSLLAICLQYCVQNLETFCDYDHDSECYCLRDSTTLPTEICERIIKVRSETVFELDDSFLNIFSDVEQTHLKRLNLRDSTLSDAGLLKVLHHQPTELDLSGCVNLTSNSLLNINRYGQRLQTLFLGNSSRLCEAELPESFGSTGISQSRGVGDVQVFGVDYVFDCPDVRAFSLHDLMDHNGNHLIPVILKPFLRLTYLDLSGCHIDVDHHDCIGQLSNLLTLIFYDVPIKIQNAVLFLSKLKNLRYVGVLYTCPMGFFLEKLSRGW